MAPRARQAKSKARVTQYEQLLAEDQAQETRQGVAQITIPPGPRLGDLVVEAKGLRKGYGDRLLIDGLDFTLPRGGIVGVIGPNGAGKTTLFRMIVGQEQPDAGTLRLGDTVVPAYVDQSRESLAGRPHALGGDLGRRQRGRHGREARGQLARLRRVVQLQGARPAEEGARPLGRRAQPAAPGEAAARAAATCCCSTSRRTTSTSTRCARSRTRWSRSPAAPS